MANDLNAQKGTYVASEWKDGVDDFTPITPERLNHIEKGVESNSQDLKKLGDAWDSASSEFSVNTSRVKSVRIDAINTGSGELLKHPGFYFTMADGTELLLYASENGLFFRNQTDNSTIWTK